MAWGLLFVEEEGGRVDDPVMWGGFASSSWVLEKVAYSDRLDPRPDSLFFTQLPHHQNGKVDAFLLSPPTVGCTAAVGVGQIFHQNWPRVVHRRRLRAHLSLLALRGIPCAHSKAI